MQILMVAAENGALPGGKVGGVGDVVRDVPRALTRAGHEATVVTPGYRRLSRLPGARLLTTLTVEFAGALEMVLLYEVPVADAGGVRHLVVEHPLFSACGEGGIYCHDTAAPFATDAHKFALFCDAVCHILVSGALNMPDVLHLHDWHSALVLFLRKYRYRSLQPLRCVYSIHNLSIQGVRPFSDDGSSLDAWYGIHAYERDEIRDPRAADCVNLMRMGINLADRVHVVSPTYAREIMQPSNPRLGFVGGEGLQDDLKRVAAGGRLAGILNGCEYPEIRGRKPGKKAFIELAGKCLVDWAANDPYIPSSFFFARERLESWAGKKGRDDILVASIGRLTPQKVALLETEVEPGVSALEALLDSLGNGFYIMLGSGDERIEQFMTAMMARRDNFLFLRGYSDALSECLYRFCDLFVMPSSFEPCGISQMLALRAGKPCLVHKVGGLADTVQDGVNGFTFQGKGPARQATQMLRVFAQAVRLHAEEPDRWQTMGRAATSARFAWDDSVREYLDTLYGGKDPENKG